MTSWQLGPVLRAIRGHRAAATLVVVQLAVGLAITVLAVLIGDFFFDSGRRTEGVSEQLSVVEVHWTRDARHADVLATIRRVPGVTDATQLAMPLRLLERSPDDLRTPSAHTQVHEVAAGPRIAAIADLRIEAGRDFVDADVTGTVTAAIVTPAIASRLWPHRDPVGQPFQSRAHGAAVVVGVADLETILFGREPVGVIYAVDATARSRMTVLVRGDVASLADELRAPGQHATVESAHAATRQFARPIASVLGILGTMVGAIVIVIVIGSMGLTYFLVSTRTREIGVRRALGARQRDVVRYFLLENLVLTMAGALLGLGIMALVLPALFEKQRGFSVQWSLVFGSVAGVVVLNLLATLIPARRAAAVPPVVASRTA